MAIVPENPLLIDTQPKTKIESPKKRGRMRFALAGYCLVILAATAFTFITGDKPVPANHNSFITQEEVVPPTLNQLNEALAGADSYMGGVYKTIDSSNSAMSEYYGLPLRAYYDNYDQWRLLGENQIASCNEDGCTNTTKVSLLSESPTEETLECDFYSQSYSSSPRLRVNINWADEGETQVTVINEAFIDSETNADLYLSDDYLDRYSKDNVGQSKTYVISSSNRALFQSFRYTDRHAGQSGQNYFLEKGDLEKYSALAASLENRGLIPNRDLSAPIWGEGDFTSDDFVSDSNQVYRDCQGKLDQTDSSYPYLSKVCLAPELYIAISRFDTLPEVIQALYVLNKYNDPEISTPGIKSPLNTAISLEKNFDTLGFGIPMCSPIGCDNEQASSVRTAQFGVLETALGYGYGRKTSQEYADRVAKLLLQTQIPDDGTIKTENGTFYRPLQRGGVYMRYSEKDGNIVAKQNVSIAYNIINGVLNMPSEYSGIIPSNTETTSYAAAFFGAYRSARYGIR